MRLIRELENLSEPAVITIGNFDGVHLGHQTILNRVKKLSEKTQGKSIVLTFENHPSEVLRPNQPISYLCTLKHKIHLLEEQRIDLLILLRFTKEFSQQTAESFLKKLRASIPFSHLILGDNASFGKDRQGDPKAIAQLAKKLHFAVEYLTPHSADGKSISSSRIRNLIQQGDLKTAEKLLGRTYSIYTTPVTGKGLGSRIGFPTLNFNVSGLCLPPFGVYTVTLKCPSGAFSGIANLGVAPTAKNDQIPHLEVHLLTPPPQNLTDSEILFHTFLRPEKKFPSLEALKTQIASDIARAQKESLL